MGHMFNETSIIVRRIYTESSNNSDYKIHTNDGHELYLLLQGDVSFSIDGCIYKLEPNDMLLISNKEIHRPIVNTNIPFERIYIYFDPDYFGQLCDPGYDLMRMFENRRLGFGNKINKEIVKENNLSSYFIEMYQWYQSKAPERQTMLIALLLQLLVKINTICSVEMGEKNNVRQDLGYNEKIYQIIRYISSHLDRKVSLNELENKFFINKFHLCHLFKKITGFTLLEYMNYKKVLEAREKLKKGRPVGEVWVNLGFDDYSSFFRTFKKITGISPKEYLKNSSSRRERVKA